MKVGYAVHWPSRPGKSNEVGHKVVTRTDGSELIVDDSVGHPTFGRDYAGPWGPEYPEDAGPCHRCLGVGQVPGTVMPRQPSDPAPEKKLVTCPDCSGAGREGTPLPPKAPRKQVAIDGASPVVVS